MTIITIPASLPFMPHFCANYIAWCQAQRVALHQPILFFPTSRACQAFYSQLQAMAEESVLQLPYAESLSSITEDHLLWLSTEWGAQIPEADWPRLLSEPERLMQIHRMIEKAVSQNGFAPAARAQLVREWMAVMDEWHRQGVDVMQLNAHRGEIESDYGAGHWLTGCWKVMTEDWPRWKRHHRCWEPLEQRNAVMGTLSRLVSDADCATPMMVVGCMGADRGQRLWMDAVHSLPQGQVILPGYDPAFHNAELVPSHPQAMMHHWARRYPAEQIISWGESKPYCGNGLAVGDGTETLAPMLHPECLLPPMIECSTSTEEAQVIGVMVRAWLASNPQHSIAVVTSDSALLRQLELLLGYWDIRPYHRGEALSATPVGRLIHALLDSIEALDARESFLRIAHALCHGMQESSWLSEVELHMRASRCHDLESLWNQWKIGKDPMILKRGDAILEAITELRALKTAQQVLTTIGALYRRLSASMPPDRPQNAALESWLEGWERHSPPPLSRDGFIHSLRHSLIEARYPVNIDGQVMLLCPAEAQLIAPDRLIIAGCHEGAWPSDACLSMPWNMASRYSPLPTKEAHIGSMAHDFMSLLAHPHVVLTRAKEQAGTPLRPSRWWLMLESFAHHHAMKETILPRETLRLYAQSLYQHLPSAYLAPTEANPPLEARPRALSVTRIERWMQDPYSIYASALLRLTHYDPLPTRFSVREFGTFLHQLLEQFSRDYDGTLSDEALHVLLQQGAALLSHQFGEPDFIWRAKIHHLSPHIIDFEKARRDTTLLHVLTEKRYEKRIALADGSHFTLSGVADRVEIEAAHCTILDFKTGTLPDNRDITEGLMPQMPLLGLIHTEETAATSLAYVPVTVASCEVRMLSGDHAALIAQAEDGLRALLKHFLLQRTPFLASPYGEKYLRYNHFAHLERVKEWI